MATLEWDTDFFSAPLHTKLNKLVSTYKILVTVTDWNDKTDPREWIIDVNEATLRFAYAPVHVDHFKSCEVTVTVRVNKRNREKDRDRKREREVR